MNNVVLAILVMVFAAIVLAVQGVYFYFKGQRDDLAEKTQRRLGIDKEEEEDALASLMREQATDSMIERLGKWGQGMQETIQQAGMELTLTTFVTYIGVLFFTVLIFTLLFIGVPGILLPFAAAYIPVWWVKSSAASRAKKMLGQMPDALEMMGRAMQTGAGLIDCFRLASVEMVDPIAGEFGRIADEVKYGKDWRVSLEQLVQRNPALFDLRLMVSSILLQRETGGNMIETLGRISKLIRQRAAFDGKVKAMTSEARASGMVLALMPIGVLMLVMVANAPYLSPLWNTAVGQMCIVYAVASYGFGLFLMSSMSQVEV